MQFERRLGGGKLRHPGLGGGKISIGGNKIPPAKTPIQQARELLGKVNAFVALARQVTYVFYLVSFILITGLSRQNHVFNEPFVRFNRGFVYLIQHFTGDTRNCRGRAQPDGGGPRGEPVADHDEGEQHGAREPKLIPRQTHAQGRTTSCVRLLHYVHIGLGFSTEVKLRLREPPSSGG